MERKGLLNQTEAVSFCTDIKPEEVQRMDWLKRFVDNIKNADSRRDSIVKNKKMEYKTDFYKKLIDFQVNFYSEINLYKQIFKYEYSL